MLVRQSMNLVLFLIFVFNLDDDEHQWIIRTCRKGWDEHVGGQNPRLKPDMSKLKN